MLSINSGNCERYASKMKPLAKQANEKLEKSLAMDFKDIWMKFEADEVSGSQLCSYLDWAYYARVALKGEMAQYQKIHETLCQEYFNSITQANISVEWADKGIMSNEFMRKFLTIMSFADEAQEQNTLAKKTQFYNFQTLNSDILNTFALATAQNPKMPTTMEKLPASSSIVFEMFVDGTIKGYLNDEEYTLGGCQP